MKSAPRAAARLRCGAAAASAAAPRADIYLLTDQPRATRSGTVLSDLMHNPVMTGGLMMAMVAAVALFNPALHASLTHAMPGVLGVAPPAIDMANPAMLLMVALQAGLAAIDIHHAKLGVTRLSMENAAVKHGICSVALMGAYMMHINTEPFTLFCAAFFGMMALWANKAAAAMGGSPSGIGAFTLNALTAEGVIAMSMGFTMMFTKVNLLAVMMTPLGLTAPAVAVAMPWDVLVPTLLMGLGASRMHAGMHTPTMRDYSNAAVSSGTITAAVLVTFLLGRASMDAVGMVLSMPAVMALWAFVSAAMMRH